MRDSTKIVFETEWFSIERQTYDDVPALQRKPYYRINAPDGVIVLALTQSAEIILVSQFRPALGFRTLELPAGAVDVNEDPTKAAARELYEETGYICRDLAPLGIWSPMASRLNACHHYFLGLEASRDPSYVPSEDIKVVSVTRAEMQRLVLSEQFRQGGALALLLLADWKFGTSLTAPQSM